VKYLFYWVVSVIIWLGALWVAEHIIPKDAARFWIMLWGVVIGGAIDLVYNLIVAPRRRRA